MNKLPPYWDKTLTLYCKYQKDSDSRIYWFRHVLPTCFYGNAVQKDISGEWVSIKGVQIARIPSNVNYKSLVDWASLSLEDKAVYWTIAPEFIIANGDITDIIKGRIVDEGITDIEFLAKYKISGVFKVNSASENIRTSVSIPHIKALGE